LGLLGYEWLCVAYGAAALGAAALLALREPLPLLPQLLVLCALSAVSVHFSVAADDAEKISSSAQSVVAAAAVVAFRASSPLLAPLLVGIAGAFWRVPRNRHQWFTIPGNFAAYGLPALGAAVAVHALDLTAHPGAFALAAVAVPASLALIAVDVALVTFYIALCEDVPFLAAARSLRGTTIVAASYVPFVFGACVGELELRFGLVVLGLAAVTFVMVQAVFSGIRKLVESERETCDGLIAAMESKDPYTAGHSKRVVRYARYMGERLGFKGRDLARLERQALMHDVGKLAVPNHVLRKPGKLEPDERELMFRHEPAGEAILASIPMLALSADIAAGRGHGDDLDGPVRAAHIVHAADSFDAMTSTRAYRRAKRQDEAHAEMLRCAGTQFHQACVDALFAELDARGEVYGEGGIEAEEVEYATPPPVGALGSTLAEQAAADARAGIARAIEAPTGHVEVEIPHARLSRNAIIAIVLGAVALTAGACGATFAPLAVPFAMAALVALGELVCLRPLRGVARPLSLVAMLAALRASSLPVAAGTIAAGIVLGVALDGKPRINHLARRLIAAAATIGTFALLDHADTVAGVLGALIATTVVALAAQELLERGFHFRLALNDRLADLALLACAPLAALATAGVAGHQGLGLGAMPILVVPLALLAHGLDRTRQAQDNLIAWLRAASLAPEYADLVAPGRAERIADDAQRMAEQTGLDDELQFQLAAAAWMERVGECSLDDPAALGRAHEQSEIVGESAAILKSTRGFHTAGEILTASLLEPELATNRGVDRAGQILRLAIAHVDAPDTTEDDLPSLLAASSDHAAAMRVTTSTPVANSGSYRTQDASRLRSASDQVR
jgi:HD-GYP domain-containing protein (c-di-GMP phosphodiesterase class II)